MIPLLVLGKVILHCQELNVIIDKSHARVVAINNEENILHLFKSSNLKDWFATDIHLGKNVTSIEENIYYIDSNSDFPIFLILRKQPDLAVVLEAKSADSVRLRWQTPATGSTVFLYRRVELSPEKGPFELIWTQQVDELTPPITTFIDGEVQLLQKYTYRILVDGDAINELHVLPDAVNIGFSWRILGKAQSKWTDEKVLDEIGVNRKYSDAVQASALYDEGVELDLPNQITKVQAFFPSSVQLGETINIPGWEIEVAKGGIHTNNPGREFMLTPCGGYPIGANPLHINIIIRQDRIGKIPIERVNAHIFKHISGEYFCSQLNLSFGPKGEVKKYRCFCFEKLGSDPLPQDIVGALITLINEMTFSNVTSSIAEGQIPSLDDYSLHLFVSLLFSAVLAEQGINWVIDVAGDVGTLLAAHSGEIAAGIVAIGGVAVLVAGGTTIATLAVPILGGIALLVALPEVYAENPDDLFFIDPNLSPPLINITNIQTAGLDFVGDRASVIAEIKNNGGPGYWNYIWRYKENGISRGSRFHTQDLYIAEGSTVLVKEEGKRFLREGENQVVLQIIEPSISTSRDSEQPEGKLHDEEVVTFTLRNPYANIDINFEGPGNTIVNQPFKMGVILTNVGTEGTYVNGRYWISPKRVGPWFKQGNLLKEEIWINPKESRLIDVEVTPDEINVWRLEVDIYINAHINETGSVDGILNGIKWVDFVVY